MTDAVQTVRMVRAEAIAPGARCTADVHPDEVANWTAAGWRVATEDDERPQPEGLFRLELTGSPALVIGDMVELGHGRAALFTRRLTDGEQEQLRAGGEPGDGFVGTLVNLRRLRDDDDDAPSNAPGAHAPGEVQGTLVTDAPQAGAGEGTQLPTVDATTGEPVPPVRRAEKPLEEQTIEELHATAKAESIYVSPRWKIDTLRTHIAEARAKKTAGDAA